LHQSSDWLGWDWLSDRLRNDLCGKREKDRMEMFMYKSKWCWKVTVWEAEPTVL